MKNSLRVIRLACAAIALASLAAIEPAEGAFDLNHYILGCGDACLGPRGDQIQPPTPRWIPSGGLNIPRNGPTATVMANGKVLVAAGVGAVAGIPVDSAELYDPSTGTWSITGHLNAAREGHTATLLPDGRVLVVGGTSDSALWNSAELYDPVVGEWRATGNLDEARSDHTATLLKSGKVLVAGGAGAGFASGSELYDPGTGTWSSAGNLITRRALHQATLLQDGRVLFTGGSFDADLSIGLTSAEIYDPVAHTWSRTGDLNAARIEHTATLLPNGKVLVVGNPSVAELFDPATGQWSITGELNTNRFLHTASLLPNGKVLVAGGFKAGEYVTLDSAELYDPASGKWEYTSSLQTPRVYNTTTVLPNGIVLAAAGASGIGTTAYRALDSTELYGTFPPGTIVPGLTGTWFDPAQSGLGIFIEVLPNAHLLAWWFAFNPAGTEQTWFGGIGTYAKDTATVAVSETTGGRWIPNFDPTRIVNAGWGSLRFTFTDCDHGRVDFGSVSGYGSGTMNLTRLTKPSGSICP